jgi:hypothetical protein
MIELCTYVYKFQRRYWLVLSSLAQQTNMNFHVTTDLYVDDPFKNMTADIKRIFTPKLSMTFNEYPKEKIQFRGYTRTQCIRNTKAEWLLFLDADDVFHPTFMDCLIRKIQRTTEMDRNKLFSVPRLTMTKEQGQALVDSVPYTDVISNAYDICDQVPGKFPSNKGYVAGAGYFQLVHVPTLRKIGINSYVDGNYDNPMFKTDIRSHMKSDVIFRRKLKGVYKMYDLPPLIHIQHKRRIRDTDFDFNVCQ